MRALSLLMRVIFAVLSATMMVVAAGLLLFAGRQVFDLYYGSPSEAVGDALLGLIGYAIISLAVFEVAKYLLEEEVINPTEMRYSGEARRGMTKFVSTIAIAVFLEALVLIFSARDADISTVLYPAFLLFAGISLIVGLGVYQRLSAAAEKIVGGVRGEVESEEAALAAAEAEREQQGQS